MAPYNPLQIVIPIYNDWESVRQLLPLIDAQLQKVRIYADVMLVDDGSTVSPPSISDSAATNIRTLRILKLKRNLGHQRAICISLCHLSNETDCERVLVMDGDGEDVPADIPRLLNELERNESVRIVFAERIKRSEGVLFAFFYAIYRLLHRLLVGHRVRVGNFSVMNRGCLESLVTSSDFWNHYAAAVFATRQPMALVSTDRGRRLAGESSMNFPGLVMHGLSALSVFSDRISTRLLIVAASATAATIVGMVAVALIRLATGYAIPGWATNAFGILALLLVQIVTFMFTFCFLILVTRGSGPSVPACYYQHFVLRIEEAWRGGNS